MIKKRVLDRDLDNYVSVTVDSFSVKCSGDHDLYGEHPLVYLEIPKEDGYILCPYCSKKFVISDIKSV